MLMIIGLLVFMVAFIKVCSVHTPSSNPQKPPALKPIKRVSLKKFTNISLLALVLILKLGLNL